MLSYKHFTLDERNFLQELLGKGYSFRKIAEFLDRSPSSISREVNRNKAKYRPHRKPSNPFWYNAWRANNLSVTRRRQREVRRLKKESQETCYIIEKLNYYWSPEEIAYRWRIDHPEEAVFGVSTIYRAIRRGELPGITMKRNLRRRGKKRVNRKANYNSIQSEHIIPEWPEEIRRRERIGDWEGDTVYGGVGKGLIVTQVDRCSRYLRAFLLEKREAQLTSEAIIQMLSGLPVRSISLDNGSEFAGFKDIEAALNTTVFFAEPHKPWQRGTNENTNGILRFFFRKGFDFHSISQYELDIVVDLINNRPRKCLGYRTPCEVFFDK